MTKPISIHKLEGTYRATRHKHLGEDQAQKGFPSAPQHLTKTAMEKWAEIESLSNNDVIRLIDAGTLEVYCQLWAEFRQNPADMPTSRLAHMHKLANDLYLTPLSRAKTQAKEADSSTGFEQFK